MAWQKIENGGIILLYKLCRKEEIAMDNIERRDKGLAYVSDDKVFAEQKKARRITQELNTIDRSDFAGIAKIVKKLLGKSGKGAF